MAGKEEVAGAVGFEPTRGGTKNRCLTAWLRPKGIACTIKIIRDNCNCLFGAVRSYGASYPHRSISCSRPIREDWRRDEKE
jgi:hypothetical protein